MDVGTVLSVAQTLFAALQCSEFREICSVLGYKSELGNLERTVKTVKNVLLDAEAKADHEELSHEAQDFIEELKDAVYDADDLLDEFVTLSQRKHKKLLKEGAAGKVSEKVRRLFSRIKDLPAAYKMSKGVKGIRKKLDAIADNHNKFGFKLDSQSIRKRREETCSYVYAQDIIGRDADKEKIVGMLLDSNVRSDVSFLTIVGMGGLGKTTLAQLVYNDESITKEFPTRLWVCVGDEDPNHLDVKVVLAKILESFTKRKPDESTLDALQGNVREHLAKKKYLLVLDDVWNENRIEWLGLEDLLKGGPSGNWVVVTTRSSITAGIVGYGSSYELKGLSDEDSWNLFERVAFGHREGEANPPELVEMGKKIVKKCANVPLAIRVVGSLLYGQGINKWLSFEQNELTEVSQKNENNLFRILKFSYHLLDSQLKSCFSYCALFPKDHRIKKEMLIHLWMAQGFIVPLEKGQSIEDAGAEYFLILLRRCFFQDVKKDKDGEIISFKLHDLMHDVAQDVSKTEICAVDCVTGDLDKQIRHLSVAECTGIVGSFTQSRVRTLLYLNSNTKRLSVDTLLENWMCLRALDLSQSEITNLSSQISKLLHLRYLDLSWNEKMEVLPMSLTKLHNLETLILKNCSLLRELPHDLCKLVKLRCLDIEDCDMISHMPGGMDKLSCLQKLTMFVVDLSKPDCGDVLEGLKGLTEVKGRLQIRMEGCGNAKYEKGNSGEGGYLMKKQHLNQIDFDFKKLEVGKGYEEALMEGMQPHHKLERLCLYYYKGENLANWARGDNLAASLPNLVEIYLESCDGLEYLPPLGKLPHLRSLTLNELLNLEYMEEEEKRKSRDTGGGGVEDSSFFPSLKVLKLEELPMMKGWWREEEEGVACDDDDDDDSSKRRQPQVLPSFPQLSKLKIRWCPELALILTVPNVEQVELWGVNKKLRVRGAVAEADREREREKEGGGWPTCSSSSSSSNINVSKLREVRTRKVGCITSLPSITQLIINCDVELERLEQVREIWVSCCTTLRILNIDSCYKLKSVVNGGLEHLTALEELQIIMCLNVTLNINDEEGDGDGKGKGVGDGNISSSRPFVILSTLRSLHLQNLPKLVNLPEWMQHLTSLHSLNIINCKAIESLPDWMPHLTSLTHLQILYCSEELKRRCSKSPPGQDWPKIHRIPHLTI